jgi:hypothetical protein
MFSYYHRIYLNGLSHHSEAGYNYSSMVEQPNFGKVFKFVRLVKFNFETKFSQGAWQKANSFPYPFLLPHGNPFRKVDNTHLTPFNMGINY